MAVDRLPLPENDPVALLAQHGVDAVMVSDESDLDSVGSSPRPHLTLLDVTPMDAAALRRCIERCSRLKLPVIALVSKGHLADIDVTLNIDDFVVVPASSEELVARANRVLSRNRSSGDDDVIQVGALAINPTSYEVTLEGVRIDLRFKEYELLRLLATNPGRVYTREALLSQIWGYDYFGGTRTVDVHVRRLRSKIEGADHSFIETIWNVGYRFRAVSP